MISNKHQYQSQKQYIFMCTHKLPSTIKYLNSTPQTKYNKPHCYINTKCVYMYINYEISAKQQDQW